MSHEITKEQLAAEAAGLPVPCSEKQTAALTGRAVKSLQHDRWRGRKTGTPVGIAHVRDGGRVYYLLSTIRAHLAKVESTLTSAA